MTRPVLLVDGNNLLVRAVEATRRAAMNSPTGVDTSALVVFTNTLTRYVREVKPYQLVVLWDSATPDVPNWRKSLFPDYKANRPTAPDHYRRSSRELATKFLNLASVPQLGIRGQEADDLIAAYWRNSAYPVVILSNDKDMLQLVGKNPYGTTCTQIRISSADTPTEYWDTARVLSHYGCAPSQLPIAMSLAGDTSDNIPGVPRVGMKTAVKHLAAAEWNPDKVDHPVVTAHREQIRLYRQLVDLRAEQHTLVLPHLPSFLPTTVGPDDRWRALASFLKEHGLREIERRLFAGELW